MMSKMWRTGRGDKRGVDKNVGSNLNRIHFKCFPSSEIRGTKNEKVMAGHERSMEGQVRSLGGHGRSVKGHGRPVGVHGR